MLLQTYKLENASATVFAETYCSLGCVNNAFCSKGHSPDIKNSGFQIYSQAAGDDCRNRRFLTYSSDKRTPRSQTYSPVVETDPQVSNV
jgi:hypothetical protein